MMNKFLSLRCQSRKPWIFGLVLITIIVPFSGFQTAKAGPFIIYVDGDATGANDGSSWTDAYTYLQDALDETNANGSSIYEIWVAEGVYYPDEDQDSDHDNNSPDEFFTVFYDNVQLYGGFNGTETSRDQRDWESNLTILSGDIDANDTNWDGNYIAEDWTDISGSNAYHVILLNGSSNDDITLDTVIDGFVITAGQADPINNYGGGILCFAAGSTPPSGVCSPTLRNLTIQGNRAYVGGGLMLYTNNDGVSNPYMSNISIIGNRSTDDGGGMYVFTANDPDGESLPVMANIVFFRNYAEDDGGGLGLMGGQGGSTCSPIMTNVVFYDNHSDSDGGGMYAAAGFGGVVQLELTNVSFHDNYAAGYGGAIYNDRTTTGTFTMDLNNAVLWGNSAAISGLEIYNDLTDPVINHSDIQGCGGSGGGWDSSCGTDNGGNIDVDPLFVNPAGDVLSLEITSPAIEAGDNALLPSDLTDIDQDGDTGESLPLDLVGDPRVVCNDVDMGAYENQDMPVFDDVSCSQWAHDYIHALYLSGITGGCSTVPPLYCPSDTVTRDQMAVFLERGIHGSGYAPPAPMGIFNDVPVDYWAAKWIEALYNDGITGGCGGNNYCPSNPVTRAQMAIFLLRSKHGAAYDPPAATGVFNDVPVDHWAADWIEQLAAEGITSSCGGGNYCPADSVTRDQMAVFLTRTFDLPMP